MHAALAFGLAAARAGAAEVGAERWRLDAGASVGWLNDEVTACAGGCSSRLEVDARLSPTLRLSYFWTEHVSLELDLRYDAYRWDLKGASDERSSHFWSYTTAAGLAYYFDERTLGILGPVRPLVKAAVGYRVLDNELDSPVRDFDNGFGGEVAVGLERGRFTARCGYSYYRHGIGSKTATASDTEALVLDDVFLELTYRIASW